MVRRIWEGSERTKIILRTSNADSVSFFLFSPVQLNSLVLSIIVSSDPFLLLFFLFLATVVSGFILGAVKGSSSHLVVIIILDLLSLWVGLTFENNMIWILMYVPLIIIIFIFFKTKIRKIEVPVLAYISRHWLIFLGLFLTAWACVFLYARVLYPHYFNPNSVIGFLVDLNSDNALQGFGVSVVVWGVIFLFMWPFISGFYLLFIFLFFKARNIQKIRFSNLRLYSGPRKMPEYLADMVIDEEVVLLDVYLSATIYKRLKANQPVEISKYKTDGKASYLFY